MDIHTSSLSYTLSLTDKHAHGRERRRLAGFHVQPPEVDRGIQGGQRGLEEVGVAHGDAAGGDEDVAAVVVCVDRPGVGHDNEQNRRTHGAAA